MNGLVRVEGFWVPCQSPAVAALVATALLDPHEVAGEAVALRAVEPQMDSAGQ